MRQSIRETREFKIADAMFRAQQSDGLTMDDLSNVGFHEITEFISMQIKNDQAAGSPLSVDKVRALRSCAGKLMNAYGLAPGVAWDLVNKHGIKMLGRGAGRRTQRAWAKRAMKEQSLDIYNRMGTDPICGQGECRA